MIINVEYLRIFVDLIRINDFAYEERGGYFRSCSSLCHGIKLTRFHLSFVDCAGNLKGESLGEWKRSLYWRNL